MTEKQAESVNESNLDEQEGETDQQEIEHHAQRTRRRAPFFAAPQPGERQQDQDGACDDSLQQRQNDDQVSSIEEHEPALPA